MDWFHLSILPFLTIFIDEEMAWTSMWRKNASDILVEMSVLEAVGIELVCNKMFSCFVPEVVADVLKTNGVFGLKRRKYFFVLQMHLVLHFYFSCTGTYPYGIVLYMEPVAPICRVDRAVRCITLQIEGARLMRNICKK